MDLSPPDGADLMHAAYLAGVNFFDTAEIYGTYAHLRHLCARLPRSQLVIASKTYAATAADARRDFERARHEIGTDYIDIFLLHEQESAFTLAGHRPALLQLVHLRQQGLIRAVGLSTHHVAGVLAAASEPLIEVVHPLVNLDGTGIVDGTRDEMLAAMRQAAGAGQGIYAMKPLAGGHLAGRAEEALAFVRDIPYIHAVALGIGSPDQLAYAALVMGREPVPEHLRLRLLGSRRRLVVEPWCEGCGSCVAVCPQSALAVSGGKVLVDQDRCLYCGYCARVCRGFCLKVVTGDGSGTGS